MRGALTIMAILGTGVCAWVKRFPGTWRNRVRDRGIGYRVANRTT